MSLIFYKKTKIMKYPLRKLPDSIDLKKAEEIFSDRLAELIVMTLELSARAKA